MASVWVFSGVGGTFPAAVFSDRAKANAWVARHRLSGVLTAYPVDEPIYDWAIARGVFEPKRPDQSQAQFIQRFSSASLEHDHYEDGLNASADSLQGGCQDPTEAAPDSALSWLTPIIGIMKDEPAFEEVIAYGRAYRQFDYPTEDEAGRLIRFAVCVANDGTDDLTIGRLYRVRIDPTAQVEAMLRVIDDSGEDYLYPAARFVLIQADEAEMPRLLAASAADRG